MRPLTAAAELTCDPLTTRRILHIDMDAFYASVEQRDNPVAARPAGGGRRPARKAAVWWPRPATRRGASVSARRCRWPRPCASVPRSSSSGRTSRSTRRRRRPCSRSSASVTPLVEPLSLDEAYLDVTENAWNEPIATKVAQRLKSGDSRGDGSHRVGRRRAEQVPGEDRVRVEEARRPDRDPPGPRRAVPAAASGRRALGRRPGHRQKAARARDRAARRRAPRRSGGAHGGRRAARGLAAAARRRHRRSAGRAQPRIEVVRIREHVRRGPDRPGDRSARRSPGWPAAAPHGWRAGRLFARTVTIKVRYSDFTTITQKPHGARRRATSRRSSSRAVQLLDKTDAGRRPVRLLGVSVHNLCDEQPVRRWYPADPNPAALFVARERGW